MRTQPAYRWSKVVGAMRLWGVILGLACSLLGMATHTAAFLPDHGFLPPGTSTCEMHVPVTLTTPPNAAPVPDPFKGEYSGGFFHVGNIGDGLFYMTDGIYQAMFVVAQDGIMLVDAPPSIGANAQEPDASVSILDVIFSIPETQGKEIKWLIYSHSHCDHIGAANVVKAAFPQMEIVAHEQTAAQIARGTITEGSCLAGVGTNPPPLPDVTFTQNHNMNVDEQVLELSYEGPIHEPGNILIYAPRQKALMLVDAIYPGWSLFNDLSLAEDPPLLVKAYNVVLAFDFETFIGGHVNRLGNRADVEEAQRYLEDIKANARAALSDPSLLAIFGVASPDDPRLPLGATNSLGAFHIYLDQVACRCANLTLEPTQTPSGTDWRSRLGAADINTLGHCWRMATALRIDPGF